MPTSEHHIDIIDADAKATELLAKASDLSIAQVKKVMQKGAVWLTDDKGTHRIRRAKKSLSPGSTLHFYHNPEILQSEIPPPLLIADEGEYSVWVKPRGVLSQGTKWGDHNAINRWIETNDAKHRPAFIIHRLDRAAVGLMLIGHGKKVTAGLADLFAKKQISKTYHAVVAGEFPDSIYPMKISSEIDSKTAVSKARRLSYNAHLNQSHLSVKIETGRKHQIRIHLQQQGFPVLGDRLYGNDSDLDLQLYAVSLEFICPISGDTKHYDLPESFLPKNWEPNTADKIIAPPTKL
jgi:tRNA pseudouridine32 synthase/23S rRNA pseudouridine746 synthase